MNLTWSNRVIKYILFLFNLIFVITGIIMLAVGVSVKAYYSDYDAFLDSRFFSLPNLLIATGTIIFFISFFGCCGAIRESWFMVFGFSAMMVVIFILEFSGGVAGYVLSNQIADYLERELNTSMYQYQPVMKGNNATNHITIMWDFIQRKFECCGIKSPDDWSTMDWNWTDPKNSTIIIKYNNLLPQSCCVTNPGIIGLSNCTKDSNTSQVYKAGCEDKFGDYLRDHAISLGAAGLTIGFLQLFGIIFACHLSRQIKSGYHSSS